MIIVLRYMRNPWDTEIKGPFSSKQKAREWATKDAKHDWDCDDSDITWDGSECMVYDGDDVGYSIRVVNDGKVVA